MAFLRRCLAFSSSIGVAALVFAGCGLAADDPQDGVDEAKRFHSYPVYYAGEEVAGEPLSGVLGPKAPLEGRRYTWFFVYGECSADEFPEGEGGCEPPMQIHNYSVCVRRPDLAHARRTMKIRGATVAVSTGGDLVLATGTTTITIGARFRDQRLVYAAVRRLRTVHQTRTGPLPPPVPGALAGKLPCQHVPKKELTG